MPGMIARTTRGSTSSRRELCIFAPRTCRPPQARAASPGAMSRRLEGGQYLFLDSLYDRFDWLMLPETEHHPPSLSQLLCRFCIACSILAHLLIPVRAIRKWPLIVLGTSVPETPVDEDSDLRAGEHYVRRPPKARYRPKVHSVPEASSVKKPANCHLRIGVPTFVRLHGATS